MGISKKDTETVLETDDNRSHAKPIIQEDLRPIDKDLAAHDGSIDPENEVTGYRLILIHTAICLCTFLTGLDFNLIATAVPVITSQFHSVHDVGWYGAAFFILLCASQPLAGKTYVLFPKRTVFLIFLGIFELGSLVCALATSSNALIAGRAITGLGASGVFAGSFVVITTIIPLSRRAIWQGIMNSTFAVASVIGPPIGGAFTQHISWRWCFYINLPVGGFSALIVLIFLHLKPATTEAVPLKQKLRSLDCIGFVLFAGSITSLLLALNLGGSVYAWSSPTVIGLLVAFGTLILLFGVWEIYMQDAALIPPSLITANRNVVLICITSFFVNGPFQIIVYWLPIWFQAVLGVSPQSSGIRYLPTVIADVLTGIVGSGIVMRLGFWKPFLPFAHAMVSVGSGLLSSLNPSTSESRWIGYQIFAGLGYALATNVAHLGMQASLPMDLVPLGATNLLTIMSTSCAIFVSMGQTIFSSKILGNLSEVIPTQVAESVVSVGATQFRSVVDANDIPAVVNAYSNAVTNVFYIPAAAPVISFFVALFCQWTSLKGKNEKQEQEQTKPVETGVKIVEV